MSETRAYYDARLSDMQEAATVTHEQIQALSERELDVAVAYRVMGAGALHGNNWGRDWGHVPHYSTTWEGAGMVIERMNTSGVFRLSHGASGYWFAEFGGPLAQGDTAPEAIARAALLALAAEVQT